MPKLRNSVKLRTSKIKVTRNTVGGGVRVSFLRNTASHASTSQVTPPVPDTSTDPVENTDDVGLLSSCHAQTAYNRAKTKELSVWDSVKDDMLRASFESSSPSTVLVSFAKNMPSICVLSAAALVFFVRLVSR